MKIYNTLTRQKEEFKPIIKNKVGIYSCGPTVYSSPHIGNMYAYVCWDVLVRTLEYLENEVKWVMNITDVGHLTSDADSGEDKMEKGARREGCSVWDIAKKYENEFLENLKALNIRKPDVLSRATDHIREQIEIIKKIEANGFVYKISDGIYFDTSKFSDYRKFANLNLEKIKEGARVEINQEKKNPTDFALWKFSSSPYEPSARQMQWWFDGPFKGELYKESDWLLLDKMVDEGKITRDERNKFRSGIGFPGWHIECTAMSTKYLGEKFDIHTGGEDHIMVHHTNEIAQAYGAFGHNTANFWVHNGFVTLKGEKISKSSGGLFTVFDLQKMGFDPLALRYLVLMSHYKKGIDFSLNSIEAAQNGLNKLRNLLSFEDLSVNGKVNSDYKKLFIEEIGDDLSMSKAMALIWNLVRDKRINNEDKRATVLDFDKVLGLDLALLNTVLEEIPEQIKKLAAERQRAREDKNWAESDRLRDLIEEKGFMVEDFKDGPKVKPKSNLLK